jgi:hypothetical protein
MKKAVLMYYPAAVSQKVDDRWIVWDLKSDGFLPLGEANTVSDVWVDALNRCRLLNPSMDDEVRVRIEYPEAHVCYDEGTAWIESKLNYNKSFTLGSGSTALEAWADAYQSMMDSG